MNIVVITSPAAEPITLDEAKLYLRVDGDDEDDLITDAIVSAREQIEGETGRQLLSATLETAFDYFPGHTYWLEHCRHHHNGHRHHQSENTIRLNRSPVTSVVSIKYIDMTGVQQTLDPSLYQVDVRSVPARIIPAYTKTWPAARTQLNSIVVRFVAGWADASALPARAKQLVKLLTQHFYEHRDDKAEMPTAVANIMQQLKDGEYR